MAEAVLGQALVGRDNEGLGGSPISAQTMPRPTEPRTARAVEATPGALVLFLSDRRVSIACERCSPRLAAASEMERRDLELSPGGYGIHWPRLDEDLSVGGLLQL